MTRSVGTYSSDCNVIGSIPDYGVLLDYIIEKNTASGDGGFVFRTQTTVSRFTKSIDTGVLQFASEAHKKLFMDAIAGEKYTRAEKMIILFWQMVYANRLFGKITWSIFMPAIYSGRVTLDKNEVLSYLRFLQKEEPQSLPWSESTLDRTASKYLSTLKKLGLAEGSLVKTILHPVISDNLFVYFVRWALAVDSNKTLNNPYFFYSFYDNNGLINRLKKIDLIPYWNISQIGNDVTIELKHHE